MSLVSPYLNVLRTICPFETLGKEMKEETSHFMIQQQEEEGCRRRPKFLLVNTLDDDNVPY